ncbi:hypothetical protein BGL_1c18610 [Burkholderia plantarii]|uniref:Uncharacterized protein n=1 Tax=Burkholderia plantarii TaxID=41899 RepID=A0A0B6RZA3_BURPL|nr:hypothetical protein BGL_1c18610 [Burkholderia plantarii]
MTFHRWGALDIFGLFKCERHAIAARHIGVRFVGIGLFTSERSMHDANDKTIGRYGKFI